MKYCAVVTFGLVRSAVVYGPFGASEEERVMREVRDRHPEAVVLWTPMRPRTDS